MKRLSRGGEEKWIEYVNQSFLQNLLMLAICSLRNAHLKFNIYSFIWLLNFIKKISSKAYNFASICKVGHSDHDKINNVDLLP
jgi:hypothetical protein